MRPAVGAVVARVQWQHQLVDGLVTHLKIHLMHQGSNHWPVTVVQRRLTPGKYLGGNHLQAASCLAKQLCHFQLLGIRWFRGRDG